jgi:opacity protein-like surface antigen
MKKIITISLMLCLVTAFAFAESPKVSSGTPWADKGTTMVNIGADFSWWGIGVGAGVEYMFAKVDIANFAPLTFGVAAKAGLHFGSSLNLGVASLGTMHFGLKTFSSLPDFFRNLDWFIGLGVGMGILNPFGVGFASGGGISYYLNDKLAINAESVYTNYFGSLGSGLISTLGIRLRL